MDQSKTLIVATHDKFMVHPVQSLILHLLIPLTRTNLSFTLLTIKNNLIKDKEIQALSECFHKAVDCVLLLAAIENKF